MTWEIREGDALAAVATVPSGSVQLLLTDPPYNIGLPYPDFDDRLPWADYWTLMREVLVEARRVLCPGGVFAALVPFTARQTMTGGPIARRKLRERRVAGPPVPALVRWMQLVEESGLLYDETIVVAQAFQDPAGYAIGTAIGSSSAPRMRQVARALLVCWNERRGVPGRDGRFGHGRLDDCKNLWYVRPAWGTGGGPPDAHARTGRQPSHPPVVEPGRSRSRPLLRVGGRCG